MLIRPQSASKFAGSWNSTGSSLDP